MRQGRIESESEIRFFPLGNENDIGSKSQNENPFCGQSENPFCSSLGNENSFYPLGKSEKGKCGRAEIGHTAHAAKVQIVRIIQMNSRSEHKKMLDRGVWGVALPSRTHTITSCLLRFLPSVANPSKMGQSHTLPLFSPSFWDDATLASIRSTFPLNEPIVTIDFPVLGAFSTNGPIVVLFRTRPLTCDFASLNRSPTKGLSLSYGTHSPTLPHQSPPYLYPTRDTKSK